MLPFKIEREEKIAELKREIGYRQQVYPRLVGKGSMTAEDAQRRIDVMEAILRDYKEERK